MKKFAFIAPMVLFLSLVASAGYNALTVRRLQSHYPVLGKFYQVNGSAMHLYCTGAGSPVVVLESGLGSAWLDWQKVQPELARTMRVCSYDRAGIGWSDVQAGPRDARNIAAQLHSLLQEAGEPGPLLLVGASAGGLYTREFAATYPTEVAGLVFVDASTPEQVEALSYGRDSDENRRKRHRDAMWQWVKEASGWERLSGNCKSDLERGLESYADVARASPCRPAFATSWVAEWDAFWRSAEEVAQARCCGNVPVLIISQDPDRPKPGWTAEQIAAQPIWYSLQERLKGLSPRSRRIVARGSRHHVMIDRPDVIGSGVQQMVAEIGNKVPAAQYGTTVVQ